MKWIKASERLPNGSGYYCARMKSSQEKHVFSKSDLSHYATRPNLECEWLDETLTEEWATLFKKMQSVLYDVQQVMAGYSQDDTWSDFDKQAHAELIEMQFRVEKLVNAGMMNHNEALTPTNKDWYNAGIMAQRILQNDEIEALKKKLKQEEFNHMNTRVSWDSTTAERDELKHKCKTLEDRITTITLALINPIKV